MVVKSFFLTNNTPWKFGTKCHLLVIIKKILLYLFPWKCGQGKQKKTHCIYYMLFWNVHIILCWIKQSMFQISGIRILSSNSYYILGCILFLVWLQLILLLSSHFCWNDAERKNYGCIINSKVTNESKTEMRNDTWRLKWWKSKTCFFNSSITY